jgi:phosphate transport system protein
LIPAKQKLTPLTKQITMKRYFHHELEDLRSKLILIGEKANNAARLAIDGFLTNDLEKVEHALTLDDEIDNLEATIDQASVRYITLRSPVSSDVRFILVAIKASHDLERAGDEAHSIAKRARNILVRDGRVENALHIEEMSDLTCKMLRDAITAFIEEDIELARDVIRRDKEIDRLNKKNFKALAANSEGDTTEASTRFETIFISKSIERIADHAKNLAEEVIYLLT